MIKNIQNEKGSITFLVITIMIGFVILFIGLTNFIKIFAVKEQASSVAQQASLAATSVFYQYVDMGISDYDALLLARAKPGEIVITVSMKIDDKEDDLKDSQPQWSSREVHIEATDIVLRSELSNEEFGDIMLYHLNNSISKIKTEVKNVITKNGGTLAGTTVRLLNADSRIEVKTSAPFQTIEVKDIIEDNTFSIKSIAEGPNIPFVMRLEDWTDITLSF